MSRDSWVKEHYPIPADEVAAKDALDHVLNKWIGTTPEALEKHGGRLNEARIALDDDDFCFSGKYTCALCLTHQCHHQNKGRPLCPLEITHGSCPCLPLGCSPWWYFAFDNNPQPMIDLIRKAIAARDNKPKEKPMKRFYLTPVAEKADEYPTTLGECKPLDVVVCEHLGRPDWRDVTAVILEGPVVCDRTVTMVRENTNYTYPLNPDPCRGHFPNVANRRCRIIGKWKGFGSNASVGCDGDAVSWMLGGRNRRTMHGLWRRSPVPWPASDVL